MNLTLTPMFSLPPCPSRSDPGLQQGQASAHPSPTAAKHRKTSAASTSRSPTAPAAHPPPTLSRSIPRSHTRAAPATHTSRRHRSRPPISSLDYELPVRSHPRDDELTELQIYTGRCRNSVELVYSDRTTNARVGRRGPRVAASAAMRGGTDVMYRAMCVRGGRSVPSRLNCRDIVVKY